MAVVLPFKIQHPTGAITAILMIINIIVMALWEHNLTTYSIPVVISATALFVILAESVFPYILIQER
jgi:hypothetical protein